LKDSARTDLEQAWDMFRGISADQFAEAMSSAMSPPDAAALNGPLAEYMASAIRDGLAPGVDGWWDDSRSSLIPWGFELAEVAVPVLVMHGEQDRLNPVGHGGSLVAHIPGAEPRFLADEGHPSLLEHRIVEVHAW
jgi:pimeloyl-ACP methyl ester carboxylesterase